MVPTHAWQPAATAPLDGTYLATNGRTVGLCFAQNGRRTYTQLASIPTHWMPLPDLPNDAD